MTSFRYGRALESFPKYRAAGVKFALGTDSFPPDMIRNIDIGVHMPKVIDGRQDAGNAADIYRAATLGGAQALGRDDLGRIAVGAKADMIIVDLTGPRVGMIEDPIRTLLHELHRCRHSHRHHQRAGGHAGWRAARRRRRGDAGAPEDLLCHL